MTFNLDLNLDTCLTDTISFIPHVHGLTYFCKIQDFLVREARSMGIKFSYRKKIHTLNEEFYRSFKTTQSSALNEYTFHVFFCLYDVSIHNLPAKPGPPGPPGRPRGPGLPGKPRSPWIPSGPGAPGPPVEDKHFNLYDLNEL